MPRQANIVQTVGTVAWDGTTATPGDIRKFVRFGWTFEVNTDIATDAVFTVQSAPASDDDPCVPGTFEDVEDVVICDRVADGNDDGVATLTIPAGTPAGSVCSGTIPCRPGAFVQLAAVSGDTANVTAVLMRQGPTT